MCVERLRTDLDRVDPVELRRARPALEHSTENTPSCRVATKLGFILEGIQRGAARHADGWHDTHVHSRLRTD
jgi:ribosomal-protein-alanine N-acetyltransferase